ncbi:histidinolphosphatase [Serendipita sp. 399]|nr:histidinolphosphatase [Serendipita sp. 399]
MVQEAAQKGFKTYSLTEHCPRWREEDLYPEEIEKVTITDLIWKLLDLGLGYVYGYTKANVKPSDLLVTFEAFLDEAQRLKRSYAESGNRMEVLVGMETEHIYEEDLTPLKRLVDQHRGRIDFLVGSVHHAGGHPIDFSKERFEEALRWYESTLDEATRAKEGEGVESTALSNLLEAYFRAQRRMMEALHPEVIGHFALPLLFTPSTRLESHPTAYVLARGNIRYAIAYGALFELSSAPFRKGWEEGWPGTETLRMIVEEGGRFCLSDDAHKAEQVGLNYHRLKEWIVSVGVTREMVWRLHKPVEGGPLEKVGMSEEEWELFGKA